MDFHLNILNSPFSNHELLYYRLLLLSNAYRLTIYYSSSFFQLLRAWVGDFLLLLVANPLLWFRLFQLGLICRRCLFAFVCLGLARFGRRIRRHLTFGLNRSLFLLKNQLKKKKFWKLSWFFTSWNKVYLAFMYLKNSIVPSFFNQSFNLRSYFYFSSIVIFFCIPFFFYFYFFNIKIFYSKIAAFYYKHWMALLALLVYYLRLKHSKSLHWHLQFKQALIRPILKNIDSFDKIFNILMFIVLTFMKNRQKFTFI